MTSTFEINHLLSWEYTSEYGNVLRNGNMLKYFHRNSERVSKHERSDPSQLESIKIHYTFIRSTVPAITYGCYQKQSTSSIHGSLILRTR